MFWSPSENSLKNDKGVSKTSTLCKNISRNAYKMWKKETKYPSKNI